MDYWVYENHPSNKAVAQRAARAYCNDGPGLHPVGRVATGEWRGPHSNILASPGESQRRRARQYVRLQSLRPIAGTSNDYAG